MKWYYLGGENEVIGPVSETALRQLNACGEVTNDTRVCREGTEDWTTFEKTLDPAMAPAVMPERFKFSCPHCRQHIEAEAAHIGMEAQCPACGGKMLVPSGSLGEKKYNHNARPKVLIFSSIVLAGLIVIGGVVIFSKTRSNRSTLQDHRVVDSYDSVDPQEKANDEAKEYRFSAGQLPKLSRSVPEGFVLIPEGSFMMGDALDGMEDAPTHAVHLSSFYMSRHEVTRGLWKRVRKWGQENGYEELPKGLNDSVSGEGEDTLDREDHPAYWISWYDALKWCNAYSEMEGLRPCYLLNGEIIRGTTLLEKKNEFLITCDFSRNGYRLPTEAEWERAARGGQSGLRFAWGDRINQKKANYTAYFRSQSEPYQDKPVYDQVSKDNELSEVRRSALLRIAEDLLLRRQPPAHDTGYQHDKASAKPFHLPVGSFPPNDFGLYDMAGNAAEWCWDCYDSDFYRDSPKWESYRNYFGDSPRLNPVGPPVQVENLSNHVWRQRVSRGGCGESSAKECRIAYREWNNTLRNGFRLVCR
jgi:formylglycine-generating enzyme required for sulfatase activity/DNA-directed RNA polymerase subunit RPC12/RpoP